MVARRLDPPRHLALRADLGSAAAADPSLIDAVAAALIGIRGAKSQAKVSMKAPLSRVEITGPPEQVTAVERGRRRPARLGPDHR